MNKKERQDRYDETFFSLTDEAKKEWGESSETLTDANALLVHAILMKPIPPHIFNSKDADPAKLHLNKLIDDSFSKLEGMMINLNEQNQSSQSPNPIFLRMVLPPDLAEDAIVNLEYLYRSVWSKKHSSKAAKTIFYCQNIRLILSHYASTIKFLVNSWIAKKSD